MQVKANKKVTTTEKQTVSTLRGVRRLLSNGKTFEGRVRTRSGYRVSARIRDGVVEVMDPTNGNKWTEYPKEGKNLDPSWSPTPPQS